MTQHEWSIENVIKGIRHPTRAFDEVFLEYVLRFPLAVANGYRTIGENVFDREWDVLILLDTCRVDALRSVAEEYAFINDVESIWSVGGSSPEWIARTFDEAHSDQISSTVYLTANGHTQQVLDERRHERNEKYLTYNALTRMPTVDARRLGKVERLFTYERWGEEGPRGHKAGMTPPRYVTDRAIDVARNESYDRLLLHYFQPHSPWVANALTEDRPLERHEDDWWGYLTETGDVETVWQTYLDDLRYVLEDIKLLLENIDAETVVISSDHGEAFGEYGILGHNIGSMHPKVRKVPWAVTTAKDDRTYEPTTEEPDTSSVRDMDAQLKALGYKE